MMDYLALSKPNQELNQELNQDSRVGFSVGQCSVSAPLTPSKACLSGFSAIHDSFSQENNCEDAVSYSPFNPVTFNGLYAVGKLYADQAYSNATPAQKIVLAVLTDFCGSDFARRHGDQINLKNWAISNRTDGLFTPVQISRHIQALKELKLITVKVENGERWISVRKEIFADGKFLPVFALKDTKLTYSEILMLSILTNAACVYARSDIGFVLPCNTVKNISKMLTVTGSLSVNTVKSNLSSLAQKGLVTKDEENSASYLINPLVSDRYSTLFKVSLSDKATALLNKRALNTVVSYVDNPFTRTIRAKRRELIAADSKAIDVVATYAGTIVVEGTQYTDTDGSVQALDSSLPFYEKSLSQHVVPRLNESYSPVTDISGSINGQRYHEVERSAFYSMSELDKWHVTLDEALDNHSLAHEATEPQSFTSNQLKQIIVNGVTGPGCTKRFKMTPSKNVDGDIKKSTCAHQKAQADRQKTSHIKNEVKNEFKKEKKNAAHPIECASCNDVASLALGESNTVTAQGVTDLNSAVKHFSELSNLIESGRRKAKQLTTVVTATHEPKKTSGGTKYGTALQQQPHRTPELTIEDIKGAAMVGIAMKNTNEPKSSAIRPPMSFSEVLRSMASIAKGEEQ